MEIGSLHRGITNAPAVVVLSSGAALALEVYRPLAGLSARVTHHAIDKPLSLGGLVGAPDLLLIALSSDCGDLEFIELCMAQAVVPRGSPGVRREFAPTCAVWAGATR